MALDPARLRILQYPHPTLRQQCQPLEQVSDEVRAVAQRMLELMHTAPGVGLAAPQVGLPWRLIVANPTADPGEDRVFVNPRLSNASREMEDHEEGCLSLPEIHGTIRRHASITIGALDLKGDPCELTSDDLAARVWQHEMDHLDGVLIIDRMAPIDRMANRQAVRQLESLC